MPLWAPAALCRRSSRTPAQIPAFAHWWRADSATQAGGIVSAWNDRIGSVNLVPANNDGPLFEVSPFYFKGHYVVYFRSTFVDRLYISSFKMSQPIHVFMVLWVSSSNPGSIIFDCRQEGFSYFLGAQQNNFPDIVQAGTMTGNTLVPPFSGAYLYDALWNGADSFQRLHNGPKVTGTDMGGLGAENLYLGRSDASDPASSLRIADLAIARAEVAGSDLTAVVAYFKDRYGIP